MIITVSTGREKDTLSPDTFDFESRESSRTPVVSPNGLAPFSEQKVSKRKQARISSLFFFFVVVVDLLSLLLFFLATIVHF